jgi:hypothetical protein
MGFYFASETSNGHKGVCAMPPWESLSQRISAAGSDGFMETFRTFPDGPVP